MSIPKGNRSHHDRLVASLDAPVEWRFDGTLPTLADAAVFLAVTHEAQHLGQLAAWRRALGLPSALAAL